MRPICGVILAGGKGTRLGHLTRVTNKHLLPVADQPMIFYPLKKLVGAGVKDIMIVTGTEHMGAFVSLLGSGKEFGCSLTYRVQDEAGGIAQALGLAEGFASRRTTLVLLGDNIFKTNLHWFTWPDRFRNDDNAALMLSVVPDPRRYGVAVLSDNTPNARITSIVEKPEVPPSHLAVTGVYRYPPDVYSFIRELGPSARGEYEITDINNHYVDDRRIDSLITDEFWTDAGTIESLALATSLVREHGVEF
jgi:glucose-1-phosphate thymidylyltransferase